MILAAMSSREDSIEPEVRRLYEAVARYGLSLARVRACGKNL